MPEPALQSMRLDDVLEHVNVPSYHIDPSRVVRWLNAAARSIVGDVRGSHTPGSGRSRWPTKPPDSVRVRWSFCFAFVVW